jgi:hypothetical protein
MSSFSWHSHFGPYTRGHGTSLSLFAIWAIRRKGMKLRGVGWN